VGISTAGGKIMSDLYSCTYGSPVGELNLVANNVGLTALLWPNEKRVPLPTVPTRVNVSQNPILQATWNQLDEYFAGTRTDFDLPLAPHGTEFQREAWAALRLIPFGETRSYAQQATTIGKPNAVRAIGAANGKNPISIIVPCHRVIGSNGSLTGFGGGLDAKSFLLNHERRVAGLDSPTLFDLPLSSGLECADTTNQ
jgi:methylated-DNA-[protein]-cysteine S-methyltransferase